MSELGKSFLQKRQKNRKSVSKCRMCAKNHCREMKFWFKQKTRRRMNTGTLENHLEKNSIKKLKKNSKIQSEIAVCEQKNHQREKEFLCSNIVFSLYCKIRAQKFHAAKPLAFSLQFLFRRDQNHYSKLTSKIIKICEQILKKVSAPIQFKFFEW